MRPLRPNNMLLPLSGGQAFAPFALILIWACLLVPVSMGKAADKPSDIPARMEPDHACVSSGEVGRFAPGRQEGKPHFRCGQYVGRLGN